VPSALHYKNKLIYKDRLYDDDRRAGRDFTVSMDVFPDLEQIRSISMSMSKTRVGMSSHKNDSNLAYIITSFSKCF
jgi:hypothetical protein